MKVIHVCWLSIENIMLNWRVHWKYAPVTLEGKFKYSRDWWPAPHFGGLVSASFWLPSGCFVRGSCSSCRTWRQFQGRWWTYDEHTLTLCALLMYIYFPVLQLYYSSLLSVLYSYNWFPACLMCPWWTQPMEWKSDLRINNNNC